MDLASIQAVARQANRIFAEVFFDAAGRRWTGSRSNLRRETVACDIGLSGKYQLSLLIDPTQYPAAVLPKSTDFLTLSGTAYRVLSVETDAAAALVRLNLGNPTAR